MLFFDMEVLFNSTSVCVDMLLQGSSACTATKKGKAGTIRVCNLCEGNANARARPHTPKQYQTRATSK